MKRLILSVGVMLLLCAVNAQLTTPQPSPSQTLKQNFGLSSIELSYSRSGVKGRVIFSKNGLAPYGKVWRTGANSATTLTFGDEVTIGDVKIPAGKYGLLTIPDEKSWTIIISKQTNVTSPAAYKQEEDVVRVSVKPMAMKEKMETFTIQFANIKPASCELHIMWDKTAVSLPITTEIDSKVMGMIEKEMKGSNPPYFAAAMYYLENDKDLVQALGWFEKAAEAQPDAFWVHHQYANCLAKMGKKKEAKAAAEKSKELATKAKNDDYVKLNNDLISSL